MDAEEAGDLLDRVSLADSLRGEMSSALQFFGRTRGSHATEDSDPKAGCSIIFLTASKGCRFKSCRAYEGQVSGCPGLGPLFSPASRPRWCLALATSSCNLFPEGVIGPSH